jgi:phospholipid N-methyltransferase
MANRALGMAETGEEMDRIARVLCQPVKNIATICLATTSQFCKLRHLPPLRKETIMPPGNAKAEGQARTLKMRIKQSLGPWGVFVAGFMRHPSMVASIIPSSGVLIRHMLKPVDWANTKLFVEYGPGVGTFTRPILEKLRGDGTLIVIDTNADFIAYLRREIPDSRLVAVHGSAADVMQIVAEHGFDHADYVLSGLPFSNLPESVGLAIGKATEQVLRPGGAFLVYQFRAKVLDSIKPFFSKIDQEMEYWNVPPCFLFWAHKS